MRRILSRRMMPDTQPIKDYLCVEFPTGGILQLTGNKPTTMDYVAFSKDGRNWTKYTSNVNVSVAAGEKVYIKGEGNSRGRAMGKGSGESGWHFEVSNGLCNLSGNIMSLLYGDDFEDKTEVGKNAFAYLFFSWTVGGFISDVSRLKFPATTVGDYAYSQMFSCAGSASGYSLSHPFTKPPKLPATALGVSCYSYMFSNTNLDEMPELPATTLAQGCYMGMFRFCNIKEAKILPATTLAKNCYSEMFRKQKSAIHIPHNMLPATTLAIGCYSGMFGSCPITEIPSDLLPASTHIDETTEQEVTDLAENCYASMFDDCTALTYIPDRLLPATVLAKSCYSQMFRKCTGLTRIPRNLLPATTLAERCYDNMFGGQIDYTTQIYSGGTSITKVPQELFHATTLAPYCYTNMFAGCESLTDIGSPIIPENISLANYCFEGMFRDCTALVSTDKHLIPTSTLAYSCCSKMFMGCTHLTNTIVFGSTVYGACYESMYEGCTALTDFEDLPATALASSCYKAMFKGTGITTLSGKHLPAEQTSLAISSVYQSMFEGCESLMFVPDDFIGLKNFQTQYCCKRMFAGCKKLSEAPYFNPTNPSAGSHAFEEMYAGCYGEETVNGETVYTGLTRMRPIGSNTSARLPFTNAGQLTFASMFSGCKLMTEIPIIDVEYLEGTGTFEYMYYGCTALETIPSGMFAKVLKKQSGISDASSFAMNMFEGCTSLDSTKIPSDLISAQTIEDGGYQGMFKDCRSIETPITLPSVSNSYNYMYQNCINLKSIATMDANVAGYYRYMYQGCTGLTVVNNLPDLTSTSTKIRDYTGFFKDCTSLTSVPTVQGTDVQCGEMFSGCTALTSVAVNLTFSESDAAVAGSCYQMFYDTHTGGAVHSNLARVTGTITINSIVDAVANKGQFKSMFQNCITLTKVPTFTVTATTAGTDCYRSMFAGCKVLPTVQKTLTSGITTLAPYCYENMYNGCSAITAIPDGTLPATTASSYCYVYMFSNSGITEVKDGVIALTTLVANCCENMFYSCKSLTKAYTPAATEPVSACYRTMFYLCTNLAEVHCTLNVQNKQTSYTPSWLYGVAQTGKFYGRSGSDWARNVSGIPEGWTVEYVNN